MSDPVASVGALVAALRRRGVQASGRLALAVEALSWVDPSNTPEVYLALRAALCSGPADLQPFDDAFTEWLHGAEHPFAAPEPPAADDDGGQRPSRREVLRARDIRDLSADEREEVDAMVALLGTRLARRRARRARRGGAHRIDVRTTVRRQLRAGGELGELAWRRPRTRPRRLVLLVDVSGSMAAYADFLLRVGHALVRAVPRHAEVAALGTRVTPLTRPLALRDAHSAVTAAGSAIPDWNGGTRLGEALARFLDTSRLRGAVVVIASDGWEQGDAGLLGAQMARLRRRSHRVVWVNPHAGLEGFSPATAGMRAALPHVDRLLAGHSVAAVEELVKVLADA